MLRRILVAVGMITAMGLSSGCASLTRTHDERSHTFDQVARRDRLALIEDLEYVGQSDHPTRLTSWHER